LDLLSGPRTNGNQEQEQPSTESIGAVPTASNDNSGIPVDDLPF
jgi:hypothetical protein